MKAGVMAGAAGGAARPPGPQRPGRQVGWKSLAVSVGVPLLAGQALGIWSFPDIVGGWYESLDKPSWIPPAGVFGPVWGVLYTLQGVAAHRVWAAGGGLGLYIVQLALNLAWQPLFFKAHDLRAASIDITALLGVLVATTIQFGRVDKLAGKLMLPYLAFSAFAAAMTYSVTARNGAHVD